MLSAVRRLYALFGYSEVFIRSRGQISSISVLRLLALEVERQCSLELKIVEIVMNDRIVLWLNIFLSIQCYIINVKHNL